MEPFTHCSLLSKIIQLLRKATWQFTVELSTGRACGLVTPHSVSLNASHRSAPSVRHVSLELQGGTTTMSERLISLAFFAAFMATQSKKEKAAANGQINLSDFKKSP